MHTLECIRTRRSIRSYEDKPVEWDHVANIVDAGRLAPSAGNLQNWKFIIVTDEGVRKKIAEACSKQMWMQRAPVHIVVLGEPEKASRFYGNRGERIYTIQSCAAAVENMLLAAHSLGLGACWVSSFSDSAIRKTVNAPEHVVVQAIVTVGYPDEIAEVPPKSRIEQLTYFERWWNRRRVPPYGYYSMRVEQKVKSGKKFLEKVAKKVKEFKRHP